MDDDPRFMPLAGGKSLAAASKNSSPSVRWTIRIISKHTPEGRNFFHDHYRPFRLRMLKSAPYAYSSTLERTALHTKQQWDARWAWPNVQHFIALLDAPADITSETETNIISALTLRGPFPTADLTSPVWCQLGVAGCLTYWEVNAVFTDEEYRRMGVASSIMDEVVKLVTAESGGEKTFMRLGVLEGNEEAVALYEKVGFVDKWPDDDGGGWEMVRLLGD